MGLLVFLGNWAGPVWWSFAGSSLLITATGPADEDVDKKKRRDWVRMEMQNLLPPEKPKAKDETRVPSFFAHAVVLTLFTALSLLAVMVACTMLRTHLFIWTVFSPKYLYAMAWTMAFHLLVSLGLGGAMWRFCVKP